MRRNKFKKKPLGHPAKEVVQNLELKTQNPKLTFKGQVLGTALIIGAVILIFALAMVSMLRSTVKLSQKVNSGSNAALGGDAIISKSINVLEQGSNWGAQPGLSFTPIPGYKGDKVYTDIPNAMYIVQINPGNLTKAPGDQAKPTNLSSPPGDPAFERTITVEIYTLPPNFQMPSGVITPWNQPGGSAPASFLNHRILQEVVRRGSTANSLLADGTIQVGGHWLIFWGDVYDYYQVPGCDPSSNPAPCTTTTVLSLGNSQGLGPGYPNFHTQQGCISSSGSCAGCFGGSGGFSGSTYCTVNDVGASNCQMWPNDPNMPPEPSVNLEGQKSTAEHIYYLNGGSQSSGETGYFYNSQMTPGPSVSQNSVSVGAAGNGVESNHQYAGSGNFNFFHGQPPNVLSRMAQNLGQASSWPGNDDLVFYVDTTDGLPMSYVGPPGSYTYPNSCGTADFKQANFRGTFILNGSFTDGGSGGGGVATQMVPPSASWCPSTFTGNPDFNGFVYVAGDFSSNGNPMFYGSIDVKGNVSGNGTPSIYFRNDFKYNLVQSGAVAIEKWQELKYFPTPMP